MEVKPGYKQTEVGVIPGDWEAKPLGSIAQLRNGYAFKSATYTSLGRFKVVTIANVQDGYMDNSECNRVATIPSDIQPHQELQRQDILISMTGNVGRVCRVNEDNCLLNQRVGKLVATGVDAGLLFMLLSQRPFIVAMTGKAKGGAQGNLSVSDITEYQFAVPPTPAEQRAIAGALSDVDALIGVLDRLIAKKRDLKQAAMQQLLTGQTRLPGFTGEWAVKRLGDVIDKLVGGGTPSRTNPAFWGKEIPWVTVKDFATFDLRQAQESITRVGLNNSASHLIPAGTLITSTRMALGKAVIYEVDVAINQDLKALFPKPNANVRFLYYWFEQNGRMIDELGSGSTVKGISITELRRLPFLLAPLPEQTAIAEVLTEMGAELAALEQRRAKTRALKQGMMQELLTGRTRLV